MSISLQNRLIIATLLVGAALRLPVLTLRPMHCDEAVHGLKFVSLLEDNYYRYDRVEYHGPTLNYFTLITARLAGITDGDKLSEVHLRLVPVFFSLGLILLTAQLFKGIGLHGAVTAMLLTAVSPAMSYYSRYYIQEMLLVFFTFALICFGYKYLRTGERKFAVFAGLALGLCHATKETFLIAAASMIIAGGVLWLLEYKKRGNGPSVPIRGSDAVVFAVSAIAISGLFYSSFFTNFRGVVDSYAFVGTYFQRGLGNSVHIHPWYYYLKMLLWFRLGDGPVFSEAFIILTAAGGVVLAFAARHTRRRDVMLIRFFAVYAVVLTVIYSAIPYKTPWSILSALHAMIIVSSVTISWAVRTVPGGYRKLLLVLLAVLMLHLSGQSLLANFQLHSDTQNPWVYAHPTIDVFDVSNKVHEYNLRCGDNEGFGVQVVARDSDYWPLPWYLRDIENTGWYDRPEGVSLTAPIVLTCGPVLDETIEAIYDSFEPGGKKLYVPLFERELYLRPRVPAAGLIQYEFQRQCLGKGQ